MYPKIAWPARNRRAPWPFLEPRGKVSVLVLRVGGLDISEFRVVFGGSAVFSGVELESLRLQVSGGH